MQRPTAVPRIPASASGVSKQRSGPKWSRSPAVARKTPPAWPTSSPITITESSRSSSTWKQSLIASTRVNSANVASQDPPQLGQLGLERLRRIHVGVLEEQTGIRRRLGLGLCDRGPHQVCGLRADRLGHLVREQPGPAEITLIAAEALALFLLLDSLEVDVRARVVGRRVRRGAVGDGLDEH